jgi:hypothetical protein
MAVAVVTTFNGPDATAAAYDAGIKTMGCFPGGRHPDPGCLFHWVQVNLDPSQLVVTDVWKSEAHWNVFLNNILVPSLAISVPALPPPDPSVSIDVYNYLTAGGLDPM